MAFYIAPGVPLIGPMPAVTHIKVLDLVIKASALNKMFLGKLEVEDTDTE